MISIKHKWDIDWDYEGYKPSEPYLQEDWNQTLQTAINQISVRIHSSSLRGGGKIIRMNARMFKLINTLAYYDRDSKILSSRYQCELDELIQDDVIYVYSDLLYDEVLFIPNEVEYGEPETVVNEDGEAVIHRELISDLNFKLSTSVPDDVVNNYKEGLIGLITIRNYGKKKD